MAETAESILNGILENSVTEDTVVLNELEIPEEDKHFEISVEDGTKYSNRKVDTVKLAYLYMQGYSNSTIAREFGITARQVTEIKRTEAFKAIISSLNKEIVSTAKTFMGAAGIKATVTLIKCLDSLDDRIKLKAATEVLDRIGVTAPKQLEIIQSQSDKLGNMSDDELLDFIKKGMSEIRPVLKGVQNENITITQSSESEDRTDKESSMG